MDGPRILSGSLQSLRMCPYPIETHLPLLFVAIGRAYLTRTGERAGERAGVRAGVLEGVLEGGVGVLEGCVRERGIDEAKCIFRFCLSPLIQHYLTGVRERAGVLEGVLEGGIVVGYVRWNGVMVELGSG